MERFFCREGDTVIHVRCCLAELPDQLSLGYHLPFTNFFVGFCVQCTLVLSSVLAQLPAVLPVTNSSPPCGHFSGTSCPSQSVKLSRTCTCLWPLPCDGVTVPHGRISLTKGLFWAPVQQGDEIILMASFHLAFLLLQLFLLLPQRCSCL